jgi:hypothetical protein
MKRISDEGGVNASLRNVGRFFLSLIPWALGIGALAWLSVFISVRTYRHETRVEERAAIYVGAKKPPKSKLMIETPMITDGHHLSLEVTLVDADGDSIVIHAQNRSGNLSYVLWHWQQISPDGTVIEDQEDNSCPVPARKGETAECKGRLTIDDRTAKLRVWAEGD